jgi:hypothetical protein
LNRKLNRVNANSQTIIKIATTFSTVPYPRIFPSDT